MKRCFKCLTRKPLSEFYPHPRMKDGHLNKCKDCARADVSARENYLRSSDPAWTADERARCREKQARYRKLGLAHKKTKAACDKWKKKNSHKVKAHEKLHRAVKAGIVIKPSACSSCGDTEKRLHAHHPDYSMPLAVMWLCPKCHGMAHWKS